MTKKLSLLKQCKQCGAKCCFTGKLIGSPILSQNEVENLREEDWRYVEEIVTADGDRYWILKNNGTNKCPFLTKQLRCRIEDRKPLDCLCYPIKAMHKTDGSIGYIIDSECPASNQLDNDFIVGAKKIAKESIERFDKATYDHWLENIVGWVKKTFKEIK